MGFPSLAWSDHYFCARALSLLVQAPHAKKGLLPSCVSHPVESWVLTAYQSTIGAYIFFYHRACNIYTTMSSASKEAVIKDAVCELGLEEHSVMQYLR